MQLPSAVQSLPVAAMHSLEKSPPVATVPSLEKAPHKTRVDATLGIFGEGSVVGVHMESVGVHVGLTQSVI